MCRLFPDRIAFFFFFFFSRRNIKICTEQKECLRQLEGLSNGEKNKFEWNYNEKTFNFNQKSYGNFVFKNAKWRTLKPPPTSFLLPPFLLYSTLMIFFRCINRSPWTNDRFYMWEISASMKSLTITDFASPVKVLQYVVHLHVKCAFQCEFCPKWTAKTTVFRFRRLIYKVWVHIIEENIL